MRDIRNVLYINSAGNNPVHEESAVAAGATRDTRSGVRKMSGVRASTALLVGGALCALLVLLGGCSESNDTCDTGVAGGDCDGDGVINSEDDLDRDPCVSVDSDGNGTADAVHSMVTACSDPDSIDIDVTPLTLATAGTTEGTLSQDSADPVAAAAATV